ncbi:flagellar basal body rod protein FlgC [Bradyrhizobium sp. LB13.1]
MLDSLQSSLTVASSGLEAQSTRMRIVSENLANATSTGRAAGADPYQRKTITFDAAMDRASGAQLAKVKEIGVDTTPYRVEYDHGASRCRQGRLRQAAERQHDDRDGGHEGSQSIL